MLAVILPLLLMSSLGVFITVHRLMAVIDDEAEVRLVYLTDQGAVKISEIRQDLESRLLLLGGVIERADTDIPELLSRAQENFPEDTMLSVGDRDTVAEGWSDLYFDTGLRAWAISCSIRFSSAGYPDGMLAAAIPVESFRPILENMTYDETEYAFIVTEDNRVILHPTYTLGTHIGEIEGEDFSRLIAAFNDRNDNGTVSYRLSGDKKILGYRRLDNGWVIGMTAMYDILLKPAMEARLTLIRFSILLVCVFFVIAVLLVRLIQDPLSQMMSEIRRSISEHPAIPEFRRTIDRHDEYGELALAFRNLLTSNRGMIEELLQENLDKERMSSLGDKLAEVAHELETRIGTAKTGLSYMRRAVENLESDFSFDILDREGMNRFITDQKEAVDIGLRTLDVAVNLMRSVKNTSAGQTHIRLETFPLKELVDDIINGLRPAARKLKVEMINEIPADLKLLGYPGYLTQVLENLVRNSLNHAYRPGDKGSIRIAASADIEHITIRYSDDGSGIPAEIRERIFERFFTTAKGEGGTGLGLYLVKNIVEKQCRGSVILLDDPDPGTRFEIILPVQLSQA